MLLKNASLYIFSSIISSFISFLMIPIYTSKLSPQEYGIYGFAIVLISVIGMLINGNLFILIQKDYYDEKINKKQYEFNVILYFLIVYTGIMILLFFFKNMLAYFFKLQILKNWIYIIVTIAFFQTLTQFFLLLLRLDNLALKYFFINVIVSLLNAITGYVFLFFFNLGWKGLIIGNLLVYNIISAYFLIKHNDIFKFNFSKIFFKKYFSFVKSYFLTTINWRIISYSDRFFIAAMSTFSNLGLYTLGAQLSNILNIIVNGFNNAWSPYFMENMNKNNFRLIKKKLQLYIAGLIILFLLIYFISPFIIRVFFNEKYYNALIYFKYFIFIVLFHSFHAIISNFLVFFNQASKISVATTIGMLLNLILNYFLIKKNGAIGVAQATLISYVIIVLIEYYFLRVKIIKKGLINV
jgi:O-antigen/teichoic acid export membrane protein